MILKLEQDIQFLFSLKFDKNTKIKKDKVKLEIKKIIKQKEIEILIEKFLNHFKIIYEINITIKELRENIQIRYNKINNNETINKENDNK